MKNKKIVLIIITLVLVFVLGFLFKINSYQELKIAQISDIHIWADKNEDGTPTFPELLLYDAIEQINEENSLDFTLITGDLMDIPDVNLFHHVVKIFNNLKKPWYYAIGNHDRNFMHQLEREPLLEILQQENHNGLPYGRYYTFEPKKNYKFIALDGSDYGIDQEQINYLVAELRNSGDKFVVIYLHTPLKLLEELPGHYAWNSEKVISVLKAYNKPVVVLAGHYHATRIIQDENILHVLSPSLKYAQEFRIIKFKNYKDKIVIDFDYKETNLKEYISNPKERFEGQPTDKFATITMQK